MTHRGLTAVTMRMDTVRCRLIISIQTSSVDLQRMRAVNNTVDCPSQHIHFKGRIDTQRRDAMVCCATAEIRLLQTIRNMLQKSA